MGRLLAKGIPDPQISFAFYAMEVLATMTGVKAA
jgi:hypothetical protein